MRMSHAEMTGEILARAASRGLLAHYCRSSRHCTGHSGLPDLIIVSPHGVVWMEVKRYDDTLQHEQREWRRALMAAGEQYHLIHQADLENGVVDRVLDSITPPPSLPPDPWDDDFDF